MKKLLFLLLAFAALHPVISQESKYMPDAIQVSAARSFHGTGDLSGLSFDVSYEHSLNKRLDLSNGLTTTIHSGKDSNPVFTIILPNQPPQTFKAPDQSLLRYTTAGIQITSVLNFNIIALPKHKFRIGGGTVLRYESSSAPSGWGYSYNPLENPAPVYTFREYNNLHQLSIGYNLGLSYLFQLSSRHQMGFKVYFQNDTNGSVITHAGLVFGRFVQLTDRRKNF